MLTNAHVEGELGQRFDTVIERFSANGAPTVTGSAGRRSVGDERTAIGEDGESAMSATIRRDGATLVLHHELRGLFDEPSANERVILWTLASLAAHQPSMNFH
jgi:hypothetical protein